MKNKTVFKDGDLVVSVSGFKGRVIGYVGNAPDKMCVRVENKNDCRDILPSKLKHIKQ